MVSKIIRKAYKKELASRKALPTDKKLARAIITIGPIKVNILVLVYTINNIL